MTLKRNGNIKRREVSDVEVYRNAISIINATTAFKFNIIKL